ncbi:hypothetical protein IWZ01DRAFT_523435, partial [Phyllosticta capitalensis]
MPAITYTLTSSFFTCWLCQAEFDLNDEVVLHAACKANSHAECLDWWADQSQQNQNQDIQCQCREVIGVADVDVPGEPTPERQMDRDDAATREQDEQELAVVEVVDLAFEDDRPPTSPPSTDAGVCRMAQEVPENLEAANLTQEAMPTEPATSREVAMSLSPPNLLVQDQPGQLRLLDLKDERYRAAINPVEASRRNGIVANLGRESRDPWRVALLEARRGTLPLCTWNNLVIET